MARRKKIKVELPQKSPQTENESMVFGNQHPLLNGLVLDNFFKFCCIIEKESEDTISLLSSLRLVCKLWDFEVTKILRQKTQISLPRLLSPYPDGLGWTWNRRYRTTGTRYYFKCPYPETRAFENVKIQVSCEMTRNPKALRFLDISGGQIKSIYCTSALSCNHQTKFLGHLLNSWCPNLETLNINGVKCFFSLLYIFEGELKTNRVFDGHLNCANLKTIIISMKTEHLFTGYIPCGSQKNRRNCSLRRKIVINIIQLCLEFTKLIDIPLDQRGNNSFYRLIENDIDNLPNNFLEDTVIPANTKEFPENFVDWGLLGHILRGTSSLQKLVINKVGEVEQCRHLFLFLLYQPSKLRSTLKNLELSENVNIQKDSVCLKAMSLLHCPLESLKIGYLVPYKKSIERFQDLLIGCSGTLNNLEIGMFDKVFPINSMPPPILLPQMPQLKIFRVQCISWLPVEGKQVLSSCPNLESLSLLDSQEKDCIAIKMPYLNRRAVNIFCDSFEEREILYEHNLNKLKINGILTGEQIVQLCNKQCENLVKVNLSVQTANAFHSLLKHMSTNWRKLEDITISLCGSPITGCTNDSRYSAAIVKFLPKFEG